MNGTMPATVNSSEGSGDTSEALGTTVWPRSAKCSRKRRRISAVCIRLYFALRLVGRGGRRSGCRRPGSVVGGVPAREGGGQRQLLAGRQRRVEAGARPQLRLPLGGGGPDVGA